MAPLPTPSLFLQMDRDLVNALEEQPIVAMIGTFTHFRNDTR